MEARAADRQYDFGLRAEVRTVHGSPTVFVEGKPLPMMWFLPSSAAWREDYLRKLGQSGIKTFFVEFPVDEQTSSKGFAQFEWHADRALDAVPDAYLILRIGVGPSQQWLKDNPGEAKLIHDGSSAPPFEEDELHVQLVSQKWRIDKSRAIEDLLAKLEKTELAKRVIGFFLCAGGTGEWYQRGHWYRGNMSFGHSEAFRKQFSRSLRKQYGTQERLRAAWNDPEATFDAPRIPSAAVLKRELDWWLLYHWRLNAELPDPPADQPWAAGSIGSFLNLDTHRYVADFRRALGCGIADSIVHFARVLKKKTGGTKLTGAFCSSADKVRILDSGVVDFISSPPNYENHLPGGDRALRYAQDSCRMRNCLYVIEDDARTFMSGYGADWGVNSMADSIAVMKRDFARNLSEDLYSWWFDQGTPQPWYNHEKLFDLFARQQEIAAKAVALPRAPRPEIAVIYGDGSSTSGYTGIDFKQWRNWELHRIGAPVACHYIEDLGHPNMPEYKLYVFLTTFVLSDRERELIRKHLDGGRKTALWVYASGVMNPDRRPAFAPEHLTELTGLRVASSMQPAFPACRLTDKGAARLPAVPNDREYGFFDRVTFGTVVASQKPGPLFTSLLCPQLYGDDPDAEVWMRFSGDGRPAMIARDFKNLRSIGVFFKAVRADILRSVARRAGCHIYSDSDDVLYASPRFVTLHAASAGTKVLKFPVPCDPFEVYERKHYGRAVREIRVEMRRGQTKTFHLLGEI